MTVEDDQLRSRKPRRGSPSRQSYQDSIGDILYGSPGSGRRLFNSEKALLMGGEVKRLLVFLNEWIEDIDKKPNPISRLTIGDVDKLQQALLQTSFPIQLRLHHRGQVVFYSVFDLARFAADIERLVNNLDESATKEVLLKIGLQAEENKKRKGLG